MTDQVTKNLSRSFADHFCEFTAFKVEMQRVLDELSRRFEKLESELNLLAQTEGEDTSELAKRISDLEEKERQRDRDEWARELALDSGPPDYIPLGDD
jgi:uncharacterized protein Yka (UPF0111/DUF47 family)